MDDPNLRELLRELCRRYKELALPEDIETITHRHMGTRDTFTKYREWLGLAQATPEAEAPTSGENHD
jgi:hypothetical protein